MKKALMLGVAFIIAGILLFAFAPETFEFLGAIYHLKNIGVLLAISGAIISFIASVS